MSKICKKCGLEKDVSDFYPGHAKCKVCFNKSRKQYYEANKDKINDQNNQYYRENKEKIKEYEKKYNKQNKDKIKEYQKEWYEANKDKVIQYNKQYKRNRMKSDPLFKLRQNLSSTISHSIKKYGYTKKSKTQELLGISYRELMERFEILWMINYNQPLPDKYDIHHIIPCHTAKDEAELIELQNFKNLLPLKHEDHKELHRNQ